MERKGETGSCRVRDVCKYARLDNHGAVDFGEWASADSALVKDRYAKPREYQGRKGNGPAAKCSGEKRHTGGDCTRRRVGDREGG